jgi:hypothetical protein
MYGRGKKGAERMKIFINHNKDNEDWGSVGVTARRY